MPDREKVIEALEICTSCEDCMHCQYNDHYDDKACFELVMMDALALLKEQETDIGNLNETVKNLLNAYTEIKAIYGDSVWVRELVRCKDCKHWMSPGIGYKNADLGQCMGRGHGLQKSDWFCADGEKEGR